MIDLNKYRAIIKGLITYFPGVSKILEKKKKSSKHSGIHSEFCYTLWLSIILKLEENNINPDFEKVGEIGSGGSMGVGLCALLTGAKSYYALDIENNFDIANNLKLLDELVVLLRKETPIYTHFKQLNIKTKYIDYPKHLIKPCFLDDTFIEELRNEIALGCIGTRHLHFVKSWQTCQNLNLDFIFSRAVLEHVNNPQLIYMQISSNLKKGAYTFHDIEFHSHGITKELNGHLKISNTTWKIIFGKRRYFLNRWSLENHIEALKSLKYEILQVQQNDDGKGLIGAVLLTWKG